MGMEKKEKIRAVLEILRKQVPLSVKQEKYCNDACVERFLKAKGDNVKKAAKHLKAVLSWRDTIGTEHLIADEFSAELAEGVGYVAGHDDESRPVMVFRIKQDYLKTHSQKSYVRLLVFTLEVAISTMSRFMDQFVLLFDASFFRSASVLLNVFMATMKIISENYPCRLHKAYCIDSPSMFPILWKGARPFVEQWGSATLVCSLDYENSLEDDTFASYPRTCSLRFDNQHTAAATLAKPAVTSGKPAAVGSTSSRFSFTVSHMDALKPWYLNTVLENNANASPSLIGVSPQNARSFSFASSVARSTPLNRCIPSTPTTGDQQQQPQTPRPSFLQSPLILFSFKGNNNKENRTEKAKEAFVPFLRFYRRPYSEIVYRAKMRPPLGGLVSIVSQQVNHHQLQQQRRQVTFHQYQRY